MKFYNKILNIQRKKTNKLKRKLNKLNKNLSLLSIKENNNSEKEKYNRDDDFVEKIYFINQIMNNLENFVEMLNYEIKYKLNKKKENKLIINNNEKIKKLIDCDIEAQKIIDKFLPLMLYYQLIKY